MKDRIIDEKLTAYAERVKPDKGVIDGAINALRHRQRIISGGGYIPAPAEPRSMGIPRSRKKTFQWAFSAVAAVFIAAAVIGIALSIINGIGGNKPNDPNGNNDPSPQPPKPAAYSLSALEVRSGNLLTEAQDAGVLTLNGAVSVQSKIYENKDSEGDAVTAVISVFYKTVGIGGLDEILVVADIGRGLIDYKDFKDFSGRTIAGVTVYRFEKLIDGEYYTNLYFTYGNVDYYLIIASPMAGAAEVYVGLLVK